MFALIPCIYKTKVYIRWFNSENTHVRVYFVRNMCWWMTLLLAILRTYIWVELKIERMYTTSADKPLGMFETNNIGGYPKSEYAWTNTQTIYLVNIVIKPDTEGCPLRIHVPFHTKSEHWRQRLCFVKMCFNFFISHCNIIKVFKLFFKNCCSWNKFINGNITHLTRRAPSAAHWQMSFVEADLEDCDPAARGSSNDYSPNIVSQTSCPPIESRCPLWLRTKTQHIPNHV